MSFMILKIIKHNSRKQNNISRIIIIFPIIISIELLGGVTTTVSIVITFVHLHKLACGIWLLMVRCILCLLRITVFTNKSTVSWLCVECEISHLCSPIVACQVIMIKKTNEVRYNVERRLISHIICVITVRYKYKQQRTKKNQYQNITFELRRQNNAGNTIEEEYKPNSRKKEIGCPG